MQDNPLAVNAGMKTDSTVRQDCPDKTEEMIVFPEKPLPTIRLSFRGIRLFPCPPRMKSGFTLRIFNTFEPVTRLFLDYIPRCIKEGWKVEVVLSQAEYRKESSQAWHQEGVEILNAGGKGQKAGSLFSKFLIMVGYCLGSVWLTLTRPSPGCNLFLTQPPIFFYWGFVLKKLKKQPYFIALMDLYPDVFIAVGMFKEKGLVARILTYFSRAGIRNADGIIVIGRCMYDRVKAMGVPDERIHFITNWFDQETVYPIPAGENPYRKQQGWDGKFVVLYAGNMGLAHYFDDLMEVAYRWRKREDVVFVFIGKGKRCHEIEAHKEKHSLANIEVLPFPPHSQLAQTMGAGDIHFVSLRESFTGLVVPSKAYCIMAAGRPIVYQGENNSEVARLVEEDGTGTKVPIGNPDLLEEAITQYIDSKNLLQEQGQQAYHVTGTKYSKEHCCNQIHALLEPFAQ